MKKFALLLIMSAMGLGLTGCLGVQSDDASVVSQSDLAATLVQASTYHAVASAQEDSSGALFVSIDSCVNGLGQQVAMDICENIYQDASKDLKSQSGASVESLHACRNASNELVLQVAACN